MGLENVPIGATHQVISISFQVMPGRYTESHWCRHHWLAFGHERYLLGSSEP